MDPQPSEEPPRGRLGQRTRLVVDGLETRSAARSAQGEKQGGRQRPEDLPVALPCELRGQNSY
jgi:hypothetical protein